jgi:dimethylamine/trimethylamine dehydrogenase
VLDWRRGQLERLTNVNVYQGNLLTATDILELQPAHVVIATGARWARLLYSPLEIPVGELAGLGVFTPDDIAAGVSIASPVVVHDFDNYYMGSALAEQLAKSGHGVTYVTPAGHASAWGIMSNEQPQVHRALASAGIGLRTLSRVTAFANGVVTLANQFTNAETLLPCASLVIVGTRFANDTLYAELMAREAEFNDAGVRSVTRIGDALAPGAIVHAIYSGHRYAEELDAKPAALRYRRDAPLPGHA